MSLRKRLQNMPAHEMLFTGLCLAFVGGLLDAYTYVLKGGAFANAQTGNIVLVGIRLVTGSFSGAINAFLPILTYFLGVFLTELLKDKMPDSVFIEWQHIVVINEIVLLFVVGILPPQVPNEVVIVLISFTCSMQVNAFRKTRGLPFTTTMCTGNLRSCAEKLYKFCSFRDPQNGRDALRYFLVILLFFSGAALGALLCSVLGLRTAWVGSGLLLVLLFVLLYFK